MIGIQVSLAAAAPVGPNRSLRSLAAAPDGFPLVQPPRLGYVTVTE